MPQVHGGNHQGGMRSGTLNAPGIVGLGAACEILNAKMEDEIERVRALRDHLEASLLNLPDVVLNGATSPRLPNVTNVSFQNVDAENMLLKLGCMAFANGAACTNHSQEPSHVLRAMGLENAQIASSVRFSLGRFNTTAEIEGAASAITECITQLRESLIYID